MKPGVFIVRQGTLVAGHPLVAPFYTRMYRLPTPGCKEWQHGGVYGIMCLFLPKKERAFVERRTVFRRFNIYCTCFYICLFNCSICFLKGRRYQWVDFQLYDKNAMF